jgi:hypothetical protein
MAFTTETLILFLRFAVLIALYLFLWQVILVVWRDLRRPTAGEMDGSRSAGRLIVVEGGPTSYQPGHSFPIYGNATVGRGSDNTIVLSDSFVSTSHAILSFRDGSWWLADLDARNGTWVNAERVKGEIRIHPGDLISIGQVKMKLAR